MLRLLEYSLNTNFSYIQIIYEWTKYNNKQIKFCVKKYNPYFLIPIKFIPFKKLTN